MKLNLAAILLLLLGSGLWAQTNEAAIGDLLAAADRLRDGHKEALALIKYDEVLKLNPNHYEALYNASYLYSKVGSRFGVDDMDRKAQYFRKAKDFAERAIRQNPTDAEGYFVMSVAMERVAQIAANKERVAASADIKKNAETALRYNREHSGAWHMLGKWNAWVANMTFSEKTSANVLHGGLPSGASNQNALNCFVIALRYKPDYILYMYDLASTYKTIGDQVKCKETLESLLKLKPVTEDDPGIQDEAKVMLSAL